MPAGRGQEKSESGRNLVRSISVPEWCIQSNNLQFAHLILLLGLAWVAHDQNTHTHASPPIPLKSTKEGKEGCTHPQNQGGGWSDKKDQENFAAPTSFDPQSVPLHMPTADIIHFALKLMKERERGERKSESATGSLLSFRCLVSRLPLF